MIEEIQLRDTATYGSEAQSLSNLRPVNYVYGANGTGKTTISRVLADLDGYSTCRVKWKNGKELRVDVYNRDFVKSNFDESSLPGVFTLGEESKELQTKIKEARASLEKLKEKLTSLRDNLAGSDGTGGKRMELADLRTNLAEECWPTLKKHRKELKPA